ncbi:hypothetical protein VPNG_00956 [Cytospora leucostoma]|uniref:Major facilitator superfamily (MFS) profile domain-containing protein n=1 Tax=Cytospora leucostoma TaxID=1230097 RepID=A0A423XMG8_9PEZI|nr:hypothetical protein VPNG_00956 [Cytospora leucostoma]
MSRRFPILLRRVALILGTMTVCLALLTSAFANKVWHLFLTQGILYGVRASVVNTVTIQFLNEWFIERKGLAFGIQKSGAGMGGIILPVLMTWGLEKYGHRTMLIAWFVAVAVLSLPAIYFLRGRIAPQPPQLRRAGGLGDFHFVATPVFILLQAGNIFQALGNFLPGIHLPSFARDFGASSLGSAGMLSLYNAATVIGSVSTGWLVDRYHVSVSLLLLSLGAASAVFLSWGLAGGFAGGWNSTWVGIGLEVQRRSPRADLTVLWGFAAAARGVGSIASGPISEELVGNAPGGSAGWPRSYGTVYGILIMFTGGMLALGGVGSALRVYELVRRRVMERGHTS